LKLLIILLDRHATLEPISGSVGVGDVVADAGFISDVDPQPTAIGFTLDVDPPSVEPEFITDYKVVFRDERVKDSTNDAHLPVFK
jgi:hypothetical protein